MCMRALTKCFFFARGYILEHIHNSFTKSLTVQPESDLSSCASPINLERQGPPESPAQHPLHCVFGGFPSQNSKYVHLKCKDQNYSGITPSQTF